MSKEKLLVNKNLITEEPKQINVTFWKSIIQIWENRIPNLAIKKNPKIIINNAFSLLILKVKENNGWIDSWPHKTH